METISLLLIECGDCTCGNKPVLTPYAVIWVTIIILVIFWAIDSCRKRK